MSVEEVFEQDFIDVISNSSNVDFARFLHKFNRQVSAERKAVDFLHAEWLRFFHNGDGEGIASLYTDDFVSMAPGMKSITTKQGLVDIFTKMFQGAGGAGLGTAFTIDSLEVVGDYIYITGEFKIFTSKEKKLLQYAKHLVIFKKVQGTWLHHRDLWCDNGPVAFEEASKQCGSS